MSPSLHANVSHLHQTTRYPLRAWLTAPGVTHNGAGDTPPDEGETQGQLCADGTVGLGPIAGGDLRPQRQPLG
jgi:hypothetical protein